MHQLHSFWLTKAIVREDPEILELVKEEVAAESAGAIIPSAAPRNIPHPTATAYLIILSNMLHILDSFGPAYDDIENERRLALQERLAGIYRCVQVIFCLHSCLRWYCRLTLVSSSVPREGRYSLNSEQQSTAKHGVEVEGIKVLSLTAEVPPQRYIVDLKEELTKTKTVGKKGRPKTLKAAIGVTDLDLLAKLDPEKAARLSTRAARRQHFFARQEADLEKRRELANRCPEEFTVRFAKARTGGQETGGAMQVVLQLTQTLGRWKEFSSLGSFIAAPQR